MKETSGNLLVATTDEIVGHKTKKVMGTVWASSVRAKSIFEDIRALGKMITGGEIKEYSSLANEARHEVLTRISSNAKKMDANAVVGLKMLTASVAPGAIEILAYGTAVKVEK